MAHAVRPTVRGIVPKLSTVILVVALLLGASSISGSATGEPPRQTPVSFRLDFLPAGYHAPFIVAEKNGFYSKRGLDVAIEEGSGSGITAQRVADGADTFGFVDLTAGMQLMDKGAPIKAVSVIVQQSPLAILSLPSSRLDKPKDLIGKQIGQVAAGANAALLPVWLSATKVPADQVDIVNVPGASLPQALADKQIDAMVGITNFHVPILKINLGTSVDQMTLASAGVNPLSFSIIANDETIREDAAVVRKFVAATVEGWTYTASHRKEGIRALRSAFPQLDEKIAAAQLDATYKLLHTDRTTDEPIGTVDRQDLVDTIDVLAKAGVIESADRKPSRFVAVKFAQA